MVWVHKGMVIANQYKIILTTLIDGSINSWMSIKIICNMYTPIPIHMYNIYTPVRQTHVVGGGQ